MEIKFANFDIAEPEVYTKTVSIQVNINLSLKRLYDKLQLDSFIKGVEYCNTKRNIVYRTGTCVDRYDARIAKQTKSSKKVKSKKHSSLQNQLSIMVNIGYPKPVNVKVFKNKIINIEGIRQDNEVKEILKRLYARIEVVCLANPYVIKGIKPMFVEITVQDTSDVRLEVGICDYCEISWRIISMKTNIIIGGTSIITLKPYRVNIRSLPNLINSDKFIITAPTKKSYGTRVIFADSRKGAIFVYSTRKLGIYGFKSMEDINEMITFIGTQLDANFTGVFISE
jgi:hypothetical protein